MMKKLPLGITVLVWVVLASLMLAIANELSTQRFLRERMGGGGAMEGFLGVGAGSTSANLDPIVHTLVARPPDAPLPPLTQETVKTLPHAPQQVMVYYDNKPLMTNLGTYLEYTGASEGGKAEVGGEDPELKNKRKPFQLLDDTLPSVPMEARKPNTKETAQRCYESDFEVRTSKVGNYLQRTNNYKRAAPDSCSAPKHELVGNFYVLETL